MVKTWCENSTFIVKTWCEEGAFMVKNWCECGENGFGIDFVSFLCENDGIW